MRKSTWALSLVVALGLHALASAEEPKSKKTAKEKPLIAHIVYFTLKDGAPENRQKLVEACDKYLSGHDGTVYYGTGVRAEEFDRDVNVRDFDVALHVVFKDKACHDKYQEHARHLQFIKENKDTWKQVRVFDSTIAAKK